MGKSIILAENYGIRIINIVIIILTIIIAAIDLEK